VEEVFMAGAAPGTLGVVGGAVAWLTLARIAPSAWRERRRAHWLGLSVNLLPFFWFVFCLMNGWVEPRALFVRILD
jgi:hypothetical protein